MKIEMKYFSCTILFLALVPLFPSVQAQEVEPQLSGLLEGLGLENTTEQATRPTRSSRSLWPAGLKLKGEHRLSGALPLVNSGLTDPSLRPRLSNRLELSFDQGKGLSLTAGLELQSTMYKDKTGQLRMQHDWEPARLYVGLYDLEGLWSLNLGWQIFSWGSADQISPVDILNPRNLRLALRQQEKLPVLGAHFQLQPWKWLKLELAYLPFYRPNGLDMAPEAPTNGLKSQLSKLPPNNELDFSEPTLGARLQFFLPRSPQVAADIGISYLYAPDAALLFRTQSSPQQNPSGTSDINQRQELREQLHHWGLDLRLALDQWSLWLDTGFSLNTAWEPGTYELRSPQLDIVAGAEFYYGSRQEFYTNIQYSLRWLPDYQSDRSYPRQLSDSLAGYREGLLQRFLLHLDFPFSISAKSAGSPPLNLMLGLNLTYELPLIYDAKDHPRRLGRFYLNPELKLDWDWQISTVQSVQLSLALGLEWIALLEFDQKLEIKTPASNESGANALSGLGRYTASSAFYLELSVLW